MKTIKLDDFQKEISSKKYVLVECFSQWPRISWNACQALSNLIVSMRNNYDGKIKFIKLDVSKLHSWKKIYGVNSIPSILLFRNGILSSIKEGICSEQVLDSWISSEMQRLDQEQIDHGPATKKELARQRQLEKAKSAATPKIKLPAAEKTRLANLAESERLAKSERDAKLLKAQKEAKRASQKKAAAQKIAQQEAIAKRVAQKEATRAAEAKLRAKLAKERKIQKQTAQKEAALKLAAQKEAARKKALKQAKLEKERIANKQRARAELEKNRKRKVSEIDRAREQALIAQRIASAAKQKEAEFVLSTQERERLAALKEIESENFDGNFDDNDEFTEYSITNGLDAAIFLLKEIP